MWDEEIIVVREGTMGYLKACKRFMILRSTLFRLIKNEGNPELASKTKTVRKPV